MYSYAMGNNPLRDKKILFVITKSNWGGAQAYVYTLAVHFSRQGASVSVAFGGAGGVNEPPGLLAARLATAGIRTIPLSSFARDVSVWREVRAFAELLHLFREEKPDIVHLNSSKAGGIGALAARLVGIPRIVFTSHGLAYDEPRGVLARSLIFLATWITFLLAHCIITLSKDNAARARRLFLCGNKIALIYNGIQPRPLKERIEARRELGVPEEGVCLGTIAEMTPNKSLATLLEAAALLRARGNAFILCLIGDGEERAKLEKIAQEKNLQNVVHMPGFIPDAATLLPAFDIFTLTSLKEGLPTVLLEAGIAGVPVVGSRIPGIAEIVEDGRDGFLIEPRQSEALASALERLMHNQSLREKQGAALREKVSREFSYDTMIQKTRACYIPSYS